MSIKIAICDDNMEDIALLSDALLDYDPYLISQPLPAEKCWWKKYWKTISMLTFYF